MAKRSIALFLLMLVGAIGAKGQQTYNCGGNGQETFNFAQTMGSSQALWPWQMTTVAATVSAGAASVSGVPGTVPNLAPQSHNLTVTPGTYIYYQWKAYNAASVTSWSTDNGVIRSGWNYLTGMSGTLDTGMISSASVGHTLMIYYQATAANGSTTRDRLTITVVAGSAPSATFFDGMASNIYFQYTGGVSGGLTGAQCPQDQNHRAIYEAQLINNTSGESRALASVTGAQVCPFCSVPSATVDSISMLEGDSVSVYGNVTIQINCQVPVFTASAGPSTSLFGEEIAFTLGQETGTSGSDGHGGLNIHVAPFCVNTTYPDHNVTVVDSTIGHSNSGYWLGMTPAFRFPNVSGVPWVTGGTVLTAVEAFGDPAWWAQLAPAAPWPQGLTPYNCTQYDHGYRGWPIKTDQPW